MSAVTDSRTVTTKLRGVMVGREAAILALARAHLGEALRIFRSNQGLEQGAVGVYWTNRTSEAARAVFGETYQTKTEIGWFLAHGVKYGIYLELANNRQNEMLRPTVEYFGNKFIASVQRIMEGT